MEPEMVSNSKIPICDFAINTGRGMAIPVDPDSKTPELFTIWILNYLKSNRIKH